MKVEPGAAVIFTLIQSDKTVVPPVTAERSPPASRITGADSPVMAELVHRRDAFDNLAVAGDEIARFHQHDVAELEIERGDAFDDVSHSALAFRIDQPLGVRVAAGLTQRVRLRLAASFRHGFGEIGEEHGEPEPSCDLAGEQGGSILCCEIAQEDQRHHGRHGLGDEDHGVARELSRVELAERVDGGAFDDGRIEKSGSGDFGRHGSYSVLEGLACLQQEVFDHGTQRKRREILQEIEDHDHADQQPDEERSIRREGAGRGGRLLLRCK